MLQKRVIPVLLLAKKGLVKTTSFADARYIGDPINAVKILNEKEVDELMLLDIGATRRGGIQFDLIEKIASEAFMPVTYGGGIKHTTDVARLLRLGIEKVVLNSALHTQPALLSSIAKTFGSSNVIASVDFKKNIWGKWKAFSHNGTKALDADPVTLCKMYQSEGAGELLLHSISSDGKMKGYPIAFLKEMANAVGLPVIACGGAGSLDHMVELMNEVPISAFAAGSLFVYHGPHKAVLINYPSQRTLRQTFDK